MNFSSAPTEKACPEWQKKILWESFAAINFAY
jgi:hypothetical protein